MVTVKCCDCSHVDRKRVCSAVGKDFGKIRCTRFSYWVPMFGKPCSEFNVNDDCLRNLLSAIKKEYNYEGSVPKTRRR